MSYNYKSAQQRLKPFTITVDTNLSDGTSTNTGSFQLPFVTGNTYKCRVDWGDGSTDTITAFDQAETLHVYPTTGSYQIKIYGRVDRWQFNNNGDKIKVTSLDAWGSPRWQNCQAMFYGCRNMSASFSDRPVMEDVTDAGYMFNDCRAFDGDLGGCDMKSVTNMEYMFQNAYSFNNGGTGSIDNWNLSSLIRTRYMFQNALNFNQPIGNWNVTNVDLANNMFASCNSFDQDLSNWNCGKMTNMSNMFNPTTAFNNSGSAGINDWDVSSCTNFANIFTNTTAFNQPIESWSFNAGITSVPSFLSSQAFNQPLGGWDMSNVTTITQLFYGAAAFNNGGSDNIKNWDVSGVTNMFRTFRQCPFNQDINDWNVSAVTTFQEMFFSNTAFTHSLHKWEPTSSTTLADMFQGATSWNNDTYSDTIRGWTGWDNQPSGSATGSQLPVSMSFEGSYQGLVSGSDGDNCREYLINILAWTITDGGYFS